MYRTTVGDKLMGLELIPIKHFHFFGDKIQPWQRWSVPIEGGLVFEKFRDTLYMGSVVQWWTNSSILKEDLPLLQEHSFSPFTEASLMGWGALWSHPQPLVCGIRKSHCSLIQPWQGWSVPMDGKWGYWEVYGLCTYKFVNHSRILMSFIVF